MDWWVWIILGIIVIGLIGKAKDGEDKKKEHDELIKRRKEAEDYIMNSGDPEAIKALMLARANPANYAQSLSSGTNKGNETLKTTLGVMTGVVAGNMISNAITAAAIQSALEDLQAELNSLDFDSLQSGLLANADIDGDGFDDIDLG